MIKTTLERSFHSLGKVLLGWYNAGLSGVKSSLTGLEHHSSLEIRKFLSVVTYSVGVYK